MPAKLAPLFADYASAHRTAGNRACHYVGIPLLVLSGLGLLARLQPLPWPEADLGRVLVVLAVAYYVVLEWRLALPMLVVALGLHAAGSRLPLAVLIALQVCGWVLQLVGHRRFERNRPAFARNLLHLLIGPLWILDRLVPVRRPAPSAEGRAPGPLPR